MKKTHLNQAVLLFRKAIWVFVFIGLLSFNYFSTPNIFAGIVDFLSLTATQSQQEPSKQTDPKKSIPFSNSNEEKSDSDTRNKEVDEKIYTRNRRLVSEKTKLVFTDLSYGVIKKIPKDDPFSRDFPKLSNTCFASLYRFSVF